MGITDEKKREVLDDFSNQYPGIIENWAHKLDLYEGLNDELSWCMSEAGIEDATEDDREELWDAFWTDYKLTMVRKDARND